MKTRKNIGRKRHATRKKEIHSIPLLLRLLCFLWQSRSSSSFLSYSCHPRHPWLRLSSVAAKPRWVFTATRPAKCLLNLAVADMNAHHATAQSASTQAHFRNNMGVRNASQFE